MITKTIPQFHSEAEEAEWWYAHQDETAEWLERAAASGQTTTLSEVLRRARERGRTAQTVSVGIEPEDATRAQTLAAKKGLPYKTYLKMLIHEALLRDEQLG